MSEQFAVFDFGLDAEQETRARRIHDEAIVIDTLFSGPVGYRVFDAEAEKELRPVFESGDEFQGLLKTLSWPMRRALAGKLDAYKEHWDQSGVTGSNIQIEPASALGVDRQNGLAQVQFDHFDWLIKALTANDIRRAKAEGKHAAYINSQSVYGPWRDLDSLGILHDMGLRMCQLTYNTMTTVGSGCIERTDAGLSTFGAASVGEMNRLGIIVDVSHTGRQTTLDTCDVSEAPVVASHTSAAAIFEHPRAKSDEVLRAIAGTGGVVGILSLPGFIGKGDVDVNVTLNHIEHVAETVGVDHVGIGSDWPNPFPKWVLEEIVPQFAAKRGFRPEDGLTDDNSRNTIGFDDYRDFPNFTRGLVARGWSDEDIKKVLGENYLRVMDAVWGP